MDNQTMVRQFLLLGFRVDSDLKMFLFILFLSIYVTTLAGNLLIIILVCTYTTLRSPMYIFLATLSLCDIIFTTNLVPNMLAIVLRESRKISINGCFIQFYFYALSGNAECFLLTVMSYDRYLAICNPLHYQAIMNIKLQAGLIALSWGSPFVAALIHTILLNQQVFCGPNIIDHIFCDIAPLLELSCSDTSVIDTEIFVTTAYVVLLPFLLIISTYARIIFTIIQIPSTVGRQKAFFTCSSHLFVVCTYFLTLIMVYGIPSKESSPDEKKFRALMYIVITPLCNPIIYSLRNQSIKEHLKRLLKWIFWAKG